MCSQNIRKIQFKTYTAINETTITLIQDLHEMKFEMNGAQICDVFNPIPFLNNKFHGIIAFKDICKNNIFVPWVKCDFLVINWKNSHWMSLLWLDLDTVVLFDSLHGKLSFKKELMKQILLRCFDGVKQVIFQYGKHKLQRNGALTCAEHVIYFILFQNVFYLQKGYFELHYCRKLIEYCRKKNHSR